MLVDAILCVVDTERLSLFKFTIFCAEFYAQPGGRCPFFEDMNLLVICIFSI
jgi:hypothetical protein